MSDNASETRQEAEAKVDAGPATSVHPDDDVESPEATERDTAVQETGSEPSTAGTEEVANSEDQDDEPEDPLAAATEECQRLRDQLLRTAADFDNFRKRSRREVTDAGLRGREDLLKEFLPVFDNLERAAAHAQSATDVNALSEGIDLVIKQFLDTLAKAGIEKIDAAGQPFDPSLHEAIQHLETGEFPAGTVAHQVQAGYKMGDRLVRPSMVVVAKTPSA